jgi:hypothetical protein
VDAVSGIAKSHFDYGGFTSNHHQTTIKPLSNHHQTTVKTTVETTIVVSMWTSPNERSVIPRLREAQADALSHRLIEISEDVL